MPSTPMPDPTPVKPPPAKPNVLPEAQWRQQLAEIHQEEKALTGARDALNAKRRRLPMMKLEKHYEFVGEHGRQTLDALFEGRSQLIVYHFMFGPDDDTGCPGCSWVTDAMSHPAHLHARDTSFVLMSRAPLARLLAYRERMGWDLPWYSAHETDFNEDMGATVPEGENHMVSVFPREGEDIFRTYYTENRGVEHLGSHWTYLDLTPFGRAGTLGGFTCWLAPG